MQNIPEDFDAEIMLLIIGNGQVSYDFLEVSGKDSGGR